MAHIQRTHTMSLRLNDEEVYLRDPLARKHGIDGAGVIRQALRRWAREEQVEQPNAEAHPHPKRRPAR